MIKKVFNMLISVFLLSSVVFGQSYYTDPFATTKPKPAPAPVQYNPYGLTNQNSSLYSNPSSSKSTYDWNSGNMYNTIKKSDGSTQLNGYNLNTGSTWETQYKSNGNMGGQDKKGNSWEYDRSTGIYNNYGTGEIRINGETIIKPKK